MDTVEKPDAKTIVCYGDSNTWGYIPGSDKKRFPYAVRWPGVMAGLLGSGYRVIEEGLSGRTTVHDDPIEGALSVDKNGLHTIGMVLDTHSPVDLAIIMLGTNDLKLRFGLPARDIAAGVELLVRTARDPEFGPGQNTPPGILVICPPVIDEAEHIHGPAFRGGGDKAIELPELFAAMGKRAKVPVLNAGDYLESDPADGIHFSKESHAALARAVADWVKTKFA